MRSNVNVLGVQYFRYDGTEKDLSQYYLYGIHLVNLTTLQQSSRFHKPLAESPLLGESAGAELFD